MAVWSEYTYGGDFSLFGGVISSNVAANGGGVYITGYVGYVFTMSGGKISNNTAYENGGGVGFSRSSELEKVFVNEGAVFETNRASAAYERGSVHDAVYNSHINDNVVWTSPLPRDITIMTLAIPLAH